MAKVAIKSEKLTPFGGIFSIMEKFDSMLTRYRLNTGSEMQQYLRISVQRDSPFADERLFLWRLMRGRCNVTTDAPSLVSSYPSYMQL